MDEKNNDGDLNLDGTQKISEDCRETSGEQIDNDSDGSFSEDCTECPGGTEPGTLLTHVGNIFQVDPAQDNQKMIE